MNPDSINRSAPIRVFAGIPICLPRTESNGACRLNRAKAQASDRVRVTLDYFDSQFREISSALVFCSSPPPGCSLSEFISEGGAGTFFNTDLARSRGGSFSTEARPQPLAHGHRKLHLRPNARARSAECIRSYRNSGKSPAAPPCELRQSYGERGVQANELERFGLFHRTAYR